MNSSVQLRHLVVARFSWFKLIKLHSSQLIVIDEERIFKEIKEKNPVSVSLNGPDGILPKFAKRLLKKFQKDFNSKVYVLADTTWGTCRS